MPSESDEVVTPNEEEGNSDTDVDNPEDEESLPSEFVSQEEFDNLVVGHLWAQRGQNFWTMFTGVPYNSDGEILFLSYTGMADRFRAFKIIDGTFYFYYRAAWPGMYVDPPFRITVAKSYEYNPATGELVFTVPLTQSDRFEERRVVLWHLEDGVLEMRDRYGLYRIGSPTMDNPSDRSKMTDEIDEGSHFRTMLHKHSPEEEAEFAKDYVFMN